MNRNDPTSRNGLLRRWIQESTDLKMTDYSYLLGCIEKQAKETWIPLLGEEKGSIIGRKHIEGVERQMDLLLSRYERPMLSPSEAFILLASVLYHDIGKLPKPKIDNTVKDEFRKKWGIGQSHHASRSAMLIMQNWPLYRIPDRGIAECMATICAAHYMPNIPNLRLKGHLQDRFLDYHGRIRTTWLAALLALADELDNSYQRVIPEWMIDETQIEDALLEKDAKGQYRIKLLGCEPDFSGKLLKLHIHPKMADCFLDDNHHKLLFYLMCDLLQKRDLLEIFYHEYRQMRMDLFDAAVSLNGHLLGPNETVDDFREFHKLVILKCNGNKESIQSSGNNETTVDCFIKEILKLTENKKNYEIAARRTLFNLRVEPSIRQMKIDRILESSLQIRFENFGKTTFPWETLATHAGLESVEEARTIFHRIKMFAHLYHEKTQNQNGLPALMPFKSKSKDPNADPVKTKFEFIELDGEWSILFDDSGSSGQKETSEAQNRETMASDAFSLFYSWLMPAVTGRNNDGSKCQDTNHSEAKKDPLPDRVFIEICNENLAFLLDERGMNLSINQDKGSSFSHGIRMVESKSLLFRGSNRQNQGLNMVVTGPPGVGKSTLAMELISKGKVWEFTGQKHTDNPSRMVAAYFSLEQPIESISNLAIKAGIPNDQIKTFFCSKLLDNNRKYMLPYYQIYEQLLSEPEKDKTILMLPKLAPRSYGEIVDEERLFWFRYKQIARVLEAHKDYRFKKKSSNDLLTILVVDNLNAFSQHPLVRQRVHQLFQLISWGGVLGIFIVEESPGVGNDSFRSEAEFLSDTLIRLNWIKKEYSYKTIEVAKTRLQRHVLGQHPYKIWLPEPPLSSTDSPKANEVSSPGPEPSKPEAGALENENHFQVFPSIHSRITKIRSELSGSTLKAPCEVRFAANLDLCELVQNNREEIQLERKKITAGNSKGKLNGNISLVSKNSRVYNDAFTVLRGIQGGHKLAIGMSYVHAIAKDETAVVLNMGQQIVYDSVAGCTDWWQGNDYKKEHGKIMPKIPKAKVDIFKNAATNKSVFIVNFYEGFLLPEEFLEYVALIIQGKVLGIESYQLNRMLFSSTAHLPQRFPLLFKDPLLSTALVKILKEKGIGLMMIAVDGAGQEERLDALTAMADVNINVMRISNPIIPTEILESYHKTRKNNDQGKLSPFIISSDNVTGKDYQKEYAVLSIDRKIKEGTVTSNLKIERLQRS